MAKFLPARLFEFPFLPSLWEEFEELTPFTPTTSGLSVYEDEKNVYVEAALPGVDPKDIEITFDKGVIWIKGETKEEEKKRKYYRKAARMFSYRTAIPVEVDPKAEPAARCKNGVITVTLAKSPEVEPKRIQIKAESSREEK